MNPLTFQNQYVSCVINITESGALELSGSITNRNAYQKVEIIAPAPIDRMMNYSGSGLPFPCAEIAFENTPNRIHVDASGKFQGRFAYPNSYYTHDAFNKIVSSVFAVLHPKDSRVEPIVVRMELPEQVPLTVRTLTHRPKRTSPEFYRVKEDIIGVRGAEDTMRALKDVKVYMGLA